MKLVAFFFLMMLSMTFSVAAPTSSLDDMDSLGPLEAKSDLEARGRTGAAGEVLDTIASSIAEGIIGGIQQDKDRRSEYTKALVSEMKKQYPSFNWLICHVKHDTKFAGTKGVDWGHKHYEFDIVIGGTIGYEVYWFKQGEFTRHGDGGYLNWAYIGNVVSKSKDGSHLVFAAP